MSAIDSPPTLDTAPLPSGVLDLSPRSSRPVIDADEEIFELYCTAVKPEHDGGLGYVDGRNDEVHLEVELGREWCPVRVGMENAEKGKGKGKGRVREVGKGSVSSSGSGSRTKVRAVKDKKQRPVLDVIVRQNVTALRSRAGDTGSVIWRASLELASLFLDALEGHRHVDDDDDEGELLPPFFDASRLLDSRILELGAGTGVLAALVLSHPSLRSGLHKGRLLRWLATDQAHLVPLLDSNLVSHAASGAHVAELDWLHCSSVLRDATGEKAPATASARERLARLRREALYPFAAPTLTSTSGKEEERRDDVIWPDLILVADCIYNPSLFSALLDTLEVFTRPPQDSGPPRNLSQGAQVAARTTMVLIVCELRAADMLRDFLGAMLDRGVWNVRGVEQRRLGPGLERGSVAWVAWRRGRGEGE